MGVVRLGRLLTVGLFVFLMASGCAHRGHHGHGHMAAIDANSDGTVTKAEWDKHFSDADTNNDGKLSAEEIKACKARHCKSGKCDHKSCDHKSCDGKSCDHKCGSDCKGGCKGDCDHKCDKEKCDRKNCPHKKPKTT